MKYTENNKPLVCMMTQSTCYKGTRKMKVLGVLWHSTGANNPNLKRYVQPDDNAPDRAGMLALLGTNGNKNDWNHIDRDAGLNCWVGKLADGTVATVQTMPWDYRPWGCGSGRKGSCNDHWIQFEICEDDLTDRGYFEKAYREACEITAYLCKLYGIDPNGTVSYNGMQVPTILCHADSHRYGLGSNHGDVLHWFPKFGKNMDTVRADVAALIEGTGTDTTEPAPAPAETAPAEKLSSGYYRVRKAWSDSKSQIGAYRILANAKNAADAHPGYSVYDPDGTAVYTAAVGESSPKEPAAVPFLVRVAIYDLNIRTGPGTDNPTIGRFTGKGTFTIVQTATGPGATLWGKLKSGAGWISLDFCGRL